MNDSPNYNYYPSPPYRPTAFDYSTGYGPSNGNAPIRYRPFLTPRLSFRPAATDGNGRNQTDPRTSYEEHTGFSYNYGSSAEQARPWPRPPVRVLVVENPSRPRFIGQQINLPTRPESRLPEEDLKKAVDKLRKEIYSPPSNNCAARRLSLYYREPGLGLYREKDKGNVVGDDDGKRCAVCLEDFEQGEPVMLTPCDHMFHEDCIVPWVKSNGQCPVCRFSIWERNGVRETAPYGGNGGAAGFTVSDVFAEELISIIRAMEEAFVSR